ncbi:High-affinity zinc uptake system binding-protein ZnuA precursor [Aliarcobacter thereius]|uniref:Cation ABC transporter substrate-binding protein n=1 Tax=Aliarcobacter thereius TaxID=544718 RepID=A0A5R9GZ53_9BACT|nr:zinc ABC transporter substrate-binding protein [Aliarcobacter thereius]OCL86765.1 High-affinity zinc uptake system binding-protein ZnuA precursor [Aliarcobacter thereius]TLS72094.1 cation ABC transporter substrate-binding protein [Aliarcobacter thereius]HJE02632.1 zinc ABC transporter substrate-binding protein [Aliarcobacter thereius]
MRKILLISIFFVVTLFAQKDIISVTILPQKYFVEKIVKDKFNINVMVSPGSSPHNFEPKPSTMKALFSSKIYFMINEPSEKAWIEKFKTNAKNTLFVDTTKEIEKIAMMEHSHNEDEDDHHHSHHEHGEDGLDPHVWLDPISVKSQVKTIFETMVKIDEKNSKFYKENYEEFIKELDLLDNEIKEILKPYKDMAFMVFHPSWGYFSKRYEIEQISIEIEGKEPKPNDMIKLIEEAKLHKIKIVFVSPQFSQKNAKTISKSIAANVVSIDPLSDDWHNNLLFVAKEIAKSYK